jgi:hypothetical protein
MFKEELRLHKSFVGGMGSGFFPVMIFIFALVLAFTSPVVMKNISKDTILLVLHVAALMYGLSVGALGAIGEQVMTRRLGQVNMLLQLSQLHPITFRKIMATFYLKDLLFYILYSIIPLVGGIAVAAPFAKVPFTSVGLLAITLFLTFLLGMSLSFVLSALAVRSRPAAAALGILVVVLVAMVWPLGYLSSGQVLPTLGYWMYRDPLYLLATTVIVIILSSAAVLFTKERFETKQGTYKSMLLPSVERFAFTGDLKVLVAKEWVELRRSGAMGPVVTGFLGPLFAVYILAWFFRTGMGLPISFNSVFYGGMVGFLGVMTYSWLTNLEPNEFMNVQPATVDQVIKAKLVLYFMLTSAVSYTYVTIIAVINGELGLLPLALLVAASTTVYVVGVTARLTGLWTNTMLFDYRVQSKFFGAIVPPLIIVMVLSFWISEAPTISMALLAVESLAMLGASWFVFRSVVTRWKKEHFAFATLTAGSGASS